MIDGLLRYYCEARASELEAWLNERKKPVSKSVVYAWIFKSSSGVGTYETLQYDDGSLSCSCPGWTRRPQRTCKHTRAVEMKDANDTAIKHGPVGAGTAPLSITSTSAAPVVKPSFKRKFV